MYKQLRNFNYLFQQVHSTGELGYGRQNLRLELKG